MSGKPTFGDSDELNPFADPYVALAASEKKKEVQVISPPIHPVQSNPPIVPPTQQYGAPPAAPSYGNPPDYASSMATANTIPPVTAEPIPFQPKPFSSEPQPVFPSQYPPSQYPSSYGVQQSSTLQSDLDRKAAELDKREQELNRMQLNSVNIKNFPPIPPCCPIQPCYYHDIAVEIPIASQQRCKYMFYMWQFYVLTLLIQFISSLAMLIGSGGDSAATTFGVSLIFMVIFSPCSFVCWYRPIYKALRSDSSFNYMVFFFIFFCQTGLVVVFAIGIPKFSCGWINGISEAGKGNKAVAALVLITAAMWTLLAFAMVWSLKKIHNSYRSSGASLEKAQGEFASGIASNKAVQNVAAESIRAGIAGSASGNRN